MTADFTVPITGHSRPGAQATGAASRRSWMRRAADPGVVCGQADGYAGVLFSVMAWVPMTLRSLSRSEASLPGAAV